MISLLDTKDYFLFIFYFTYAVLLPGYLLTRAVFPPRQMKDLLKTLPSLEGSLVYRYFYFLFAPASGLILVDALVLVMAKFNFPLNFTNYFLGFSILNIALLIFNFRSTKPAEIKADNNKDNFKIYILIFIALWLGSILIRTVFYLPNAVPQDIDLGHHMYWSQLIVQKETFPVYDTAEVIEGEHMVFAILSKLSGVTLLSAIPLIILSFYNLIMLLALSFTSLVVSANRKVALWVLFFSGIYFAIDPPQARYVKGGVIGNTFGNLFIVLVFLLVFLFFRYFYQNLNRRNKTLLCSNKTESCSYREISSLISLILIIIAGSFYTHHLSTFLLGITLAASFFFWLIATFISWKNMPASRERRRGESGHIFVWEVVRLLFDFFRKIILSLKFILTFLVVIVFPLFIYLPFYLKSHAIETVTQDPEKDTHLGVPLTNFPGKLGWIRFILLTVSIILLLISLIASILKRYKISEKLSSLHFLKHYYIKTGLKPISTKILYLLLLGWFSPLALLSFYPGILKVDLPSTRVINYLVFPSILLGAVIADLIFTWVKINYQGKTALTILFISGLAIIWDGTGDFRSAYTGQNKFQEAVQLYNASDYLAKHTKNDAVILKDHRTISGDTWIKFFLLRGYDDMLSRTYDYKYNAIGNNLDPCTKEMITVPESNISEKCYGQTRISYVIVKPTGDEFLFWKGQGFNAVYLNDSLAIFSKLKD